MTLTKLMTVALTFAFATALPVVGQCFIDDNLAGGPCCTLATPVLPAFPTLTTTGRGGVLRDCGVESQFNTTTSVAAFPIISDYYFFSISVNGPGVVINNATFFAKYSRTWMEASSSGPIQVWRFLVNADVNYTLNTSSVPGLPAPMSAFPPYSLPVHFNGAVDYVLQCGSSTWNVAYWLTHGCPTEMHASWSAVPIAAAGTWPNRTYHFVAPGNFNFAMVGPGPLGNVLGEAARTSGLNSSNNYQTIGGDADLRRQPR